MDSDLIRNLVALLFLFAIIGVGLRFLLPIVAQHFKGSSSGWGKLADVYTTDRAPPTSLSRRHSFVVGQVLYRNSVSAASDPEGVVPEAWETIVVVREARAFHTLDRVQKRGIRSHLLAKRHSAMDRSAADWQHHSSDGFL